MKCWASCLGNCGGGLSREHYVSDGIFDDELITAFGLPWCKDKPVTIGLHQAVSKILCKTHNSELSPYDKEAKKLSRFLSSNICEHPLKNDTVTLNGILLEKWSLKTLVNLGYIGALDQPTFARIEPQESLARYLFQDTESQDGVGLYFVTGALSNESYKNGISWNAVRYKSARGTIVGMAFTLNGIRFVVSSVPVRAEQHIVKMGVVNGVDYSNATVTYRPPNIILSSTAAGRKQINLQW